MGKASLVGAGAVSAVKGDVAWNAANWDTAFGWGDHASEGYITDAPSDGNEYVRKDGAWSAIVSPTPPTLSLASSGIEGDDHVITISNYNSTYIYYVGVQAGTVTRDGNTITWTLPMVDANTAYDLIVHAVDPSTQMYAVAVETVTVVDVPLIADDAVIITSFGSGSYNNGWTV